MIVIQKCLVLFFLCVCIVSWIRTHTSSHLWMFWCEMKYEVEIWENNVCIGYKVDYGCLLWFNDFMKGFAFFLVVREIQADTLLVWFVPKTIQNQSIFPFYFSIIRTSFVTFICLINYYLPINQLPKNINTQLDSFIKYP